MDIDDEKFPAINMHKHGMYKPDTNIQTLPHRVPPKEGHQKKIQFAELPGFAKVLTHFYILSSAVYNFFLKGQIKQPL